MFLEALPGIAAAIVLFLLGAAGGALINLAIYQLGYFRRRAVSPWTPPDPQAPPRKWSDRIPLYGWLGLRREQPVHGRGFWIRPLFIELGSALGLVGLYFWIARGGLIGISPQEVTAPDAELLGRWFSQWLVLYSTLFALLTIATFIDFDERTIPDWITTPGTLFALLMLSIAPAVRLPELLIEARALVPGVARADVVAVTPGSPHPQGAWHYGFSGMGAVVLILAIWTFALIPKWFTLRWGLARGLRLWWASMLRPPRRRRSPLNIRPRRMHPETVFQLLLFPLALAALLLVRRLGGESWDALFGGMVGLAFGGGLVWAVRIVAGAALGEEAMGFGDVTLMAMIGAFLGWQATLLVFVFAPFCALLIALGQVLVRGDRRLAFGPYLCLSCVFLVVFWSRIWNDWAREQVFVLGPWLLLIIGVSLLLMAVMLTGLRLMKH